MHEARGVEADSGRLESVCVTGRAREKERDHMKHNVLEGSSCKRV